MKPQDKGSRAGETPPPVADAAGEEMALDAGTAGKPQDDPTAVAPTEAASEAHVVPGPTDAGAPAPEPSEPPDSEAAIRGELAVLQDRYLRLAAEYANYRNRTQRERDVELRRERAEVLREMLDLADNLERALGSKDVDSESLHKGVELIHQQLQKSLRKFGVEVLDADGKPFDPAEHEALLVVESDKAESGQVVEVVQRGYVMQGEVLRPARVKVAS